MLAVAGCAGDDEEGAEPQPQPPPAAVEFRTSEFTPSLALRLPRDWEVTLDKPGQLFLDWDGSQTNYLIFIRPTQVYDPASGRRVPPPADLVAWLDRHPLLRTGRPRTTVLGGAKATVLDATVTGERPGVCADPCAAIAPQPAVPDSPYHFLKGERVRLYVVATRPGPVLVSLEDYPAHFPALLRNAKPVLERARFG